MVSTTHDARQRFRFIIRPNRSLTWKQTQIFFLLMTMVTGGVAVTFAAAGFWPVLPFAGLELTVLGIALWSVTSSGLDTEVVSMGESEVAVDKGRRSLRRVWTGQRAWSRVSVQRARLEHHPSRLVLRSHGREVQLGGFLTEDERQDLAGQLRDALARDVQDQRPPGGGGRHQGY